jgi:AcrR family transcriptional regulator
MSLTRTAPRRARQARSRENEERILRAVRELLEQKPFDQLSIAEIAARAGVSVGGFYARFPSKDDALHELAYASYVAETIELAEIALRPARFDGAGIAAVAEAYFRVLVTTGARHEAVVRHMVQRHRADPGAMRGVEAWERFRDGVHFPFERLLAERIGEVRHPDPHKALRVGFSLVSSALREAVLFPHMRPTPGELTLDELTAELTRMFCGYLGARLPGE